MTPSQYLDIIKYDNKSKEYIEDLDWYDNTIWIRKDKKGQGTHIPFEELDALITELVETKKIIENYEKNRYTIAHNIKPITRPIISPVNTEFLFIFCIGFDPIFIPP